jgi:hypothetical protein
MSSQQKSGKNRFFFGSRIQPGPATACTARGGAGDLSQKQNEKKNDFLSPAR